MLEVAAQDFLAQFSTAKENVQNWTEWMKDSAVVATAAFPKVDELQIESLEKDSKTDVQ